MQSSLHSKNRKGFTLIELLIVITIVGILAVALVPRITQGPARARDVKRKADLQNIAAALELYYADKGEYPRTSATSAFPDDECLTGVDSISKALESYLQGNNVPLDQGGLQTGDCTGKYYYAALKASEVSSTASAYLLAANLETDTATTGDGIYCNFAKVVGDTSSEVNLEVGDCTGAATDDAYFVVVR